MNRKLGFCPKIIGHDDKKSDFYRWQKNAKPQTALKIYFSTQLLPCCQHDKKYIFISLCHPHSIARTHQMNLPAAGKRRLRATGYQNLLYGTFTRGKPRGIIPKVRLNTFLLLGHNLQYGQFTSDLQNWNLTATIQQLGYPNVSLDNSRCFSKINIIPWDGHELSGLGR